MAGYFVLVPADTTSREQVERALHDSGLTTTVVESETPLSAADRKPRLRAKIEKLVNEADEAELARLEAAVSAEPADDPEDLDERLWGPAPDSVAAVKAVVTDLNEQYSQRRRLVADSIGRDDVADPLGITPQSVTAKLTTGKLVGIKSGREWRLPRWQFDPDSTSGVLPDLEALQAAFPGGPVSLSSWILRDNPDFDGRTPRDEMVVHGSAPVIEVARALTAAGW